MYLFFVNAALLLLLKVLFRNVRGQLGKGKQINLYIVFAMGYLAALAILRSNQVGIDTQKYLKIIQLIGKQKNIWRLLKRTTLEKGFVLFSWVLMRIFRDPRPIMMIASAFTFFSVGRFIARHSKIEWISVYLFFTLLIFDFYLSGFRQAIAIAILSYSYDFALRRKWLPFLLTVSAAVLFHNSAYVFFAVYPIAAIKDERLYLLTIGVSAAVLLAGWPYLLRMLLRIFPKYDYYTGDTEFGGDGKIAVLAKMSVYFVVLMVGSIIQERNGIKPMSVDEKSMQRLIWLLPLVGVVSMRATVISRFFRYFELFVTTYVPNVVILRKEERTRSILTVLIVVLFFAYALVVQIFRTPQWQHTYPYSFFWQIG